MKKKLFSLLLCGALCLSMAACGGDAAGSSQAGPSGAGSSSGTAASAAAEPAKGGTLTVGLSAAPVSTNVWVQNDINSSIIMNLVVPNTVYMDDTGTKYNYLVESAEPNEDSTQWTVKLKDLTWNDGTPVTAEDLAFTVTYGTEHQIGFSDSYYGTVTEAEVVDDKTVVFHLSDPNVNFWNGAGHWIPIMPKAEFESVDDPLNHTYSGMGYGPFYVDEWVDGQYVSLKRNEHFTQANDGQGAYLDGVLFRIYTDENSMVLALENGEIDLCANFISANSKTQLAANSQNVLTDISSLGYGQISFSQNNTQLQDVAMRQALTMCIDREAMCAVGMAGAATPMPGPISPVISFSQNNTQLQDVAMRQALTMCIDREAMCAVGMAGAATPMPGPISPVYESFNTENIQEPAYDPAAAKALLEENGYADPDGDGILEKDGEKAAFTVTYKASIQNVDNVMEIYRTACQEAGIQLDLEPVDPATYTSKVNNAHDFDLSYNVWGSIDDVDTTLYTCYGIGQTLNFMDYNNEEMDQLLKDMKATPTLEERTAMLNQWQTLCVENLPFATTYVPVQTYAASTAKFDGFSAAYGNYGYLGCPLLCGVYAK